MWQKSFFQECWDVLKEMLPDFIFHKVKTPEEKDREKYEIFENMK